MREKSSSHSGGVREDRQHPKPWVLAELSRATAGDPGLLQVGARP